ncbi:MULTISPECIES: IS4 family transposase [Moorena]|nr:MULTISPECIES: IS4 family transposase [Moorena]NEP67496.1 IS4 family transposase [Moorena sp. SIO3A5]OLT69489.1 IS4 family transposase [Moorena producens 3L]
MNQVNLLVQTLKPDLKWHGARLSFLALFLIALFRVKTVNFTQLATGFMGTAKTSSNYKRLQRFFRDFELDYYAVAKLIVSMMEIPEPWVLSLDRTQWQFGHKIFNILTLGIVHQGVAFPLLWWMLDKKGNSDTGERIELSEEFIELFCQHQIAYLAADREFLGNQWLQYLLSQPMMPFRIRIRHSDSLGDGHTTLSARVVFAHLQIGQSQRLKTSRCLWGHWVDVEALRLEDNSLLVVVAPPKSPPDLLSDYAHRWGIETLFGIFKSRGFNLEDTHLLDSERLSRLVALLTIALCWAFRTGQWLSQCQPITIKKHGRKAKSIFRCGFDYLRRLFFNFTQFDCEFRHSLRFLSCT